MLFNNISLASAKPLLECAKFYCLSSRNLQHACKILVVGGGTGGCSMAARFADKHHTIIVEPNDTHYYQPLFTLIGGGESSFNSAKRPMKNVLPPKAQWIQDSVATFNPDKNQVVTDKGDVIEYELMIVAMGLTLYWEKVEGLVEALAKSDSQVCSIYSPDTVTKVFEKIKKTKSGNAIFTYPNSAVKCPGAPQKIAYLAEEYWRKEKIRNDVKVIYNTSLPVIFGVKKYADALWNVCKSRDIEVNLRTNLIKVNAETNEATFQNLDDPTKIFVEKFSFLHVCPPMGPPEALMKTTSLVNEAGFLSVCPKTLRHMDYKNIYGVGDCTSSPNSKTMAAIAAQSKVLYKNISNFLQGKKGYTEYDGYSSCPLVTGRSKCIMAEFDYKLNPKETFPMNQEKEMHSMYLLKKHAFPFIYWNLMLKGHWSGPEIFRKLMHLGTPKKAS